LAEKSEVVTAKPETTKKSQTPIHPRGKSPQWMAITAVIARHRNASISGTYAPGTVVTADACSAKVAGLKTGEIVDHSPMRRV
jgi:hypothetical protein